MNTNNIVTLIKDNALKIFKDPKVRIALIAAAVLVISVAVIIIAVSVGGGGKDADGWENAITQGIPEFGGDCKSLESGDGYVAAYYGGVSVEQVEEYTDLVEDECGICFTSAKYPRSAIYENRIITIHYNVTEMKLSVTVALKHSTESTLSGEQP